MSIDSAPAVVPPSARLSPAEIARRSKSSFLWSFAFLARRRRRALCAIYAYCRAVDDAVDDAQDRIAARANLEFWRGELAALEGGVPRSETGRALQGAVREFGVSTAHLGEILAGVETDLSLGDGRATFATLTDLDAYCHRVASAVGLACLPVFGAHGPDAERYARRLGLALQLTNILRDLRGDAVEGRVYVPRDALARAGVDPAWLRGDAGAERYAPGGPVDSLVRELGAIARERFASAVPPVAQRRALLPAEIMAAIYRELLELVCARGGRIDRTARVRVGRRRKILIVLRTWWRGRR